MGAYEECWKFIKIRDILWLIERKDRMRDSIDRTAYANRLLMAANVIFFLYLEIAGSSEDAFFMYTKARCLPRRF